MLDCERQRPVLIQRVRGSEGGIPVGRGESIEVRPGVVTAVDPRSRYVRTGSDARVEFPAGHLYSLKLKNSQTRRWRGDRWATPLIGHGSLRIFK